MAPLSRRAPRIPTLPLRWTEKWVGTVEKNPEEGIANRRGWGGEKGRESPINSCAPSVPRSRRLGERAPFNPGMPNTRERIAGPER